MIDELTLLSFSSLFSDERQLEKDYLINLMLKVISIGKASSMLEFKGGTALYLFHGLNRFSEDLDFSWIPTKESLFDKVDDIMGQVINDFNLSYRIAKTKGNQITKDKKGNAIGTRTELFIEGPLFYRTKTRHKIKIDISARNDTIMKPENAMLMSKYNDIGRISLYKMPLQEMLEEKLAAIIERGKARDLYDAYYIMKFIGIEHDDAMLSEKLKKRKEKFSRGLLEERVRGISDKAWKEELAYLVKNLPEISYVKAFVIGRLEAD